MHYCVTLRSVTDVAEPGDGARVLVDASLAQEKSQGSLGLDEWYSKAAPSIALRKAWRKQELPFAEFATAYRQELKSSTAALTPLLKYLRRGNLTLLTAAHDAQQSHLPVLRQCLLEAIDEEDQQADGTSLSSPTCYGG